MVSIPFKEKSVQLKPMEDYVLVTCDAPEKKTPGGVLLPDKSQSNQRFGRVVAAGPGRTLDSGTVAPMPVCVDDRVLFEKSCATEIEFEGQKYLLMSAQRALLGIIKS